MDKGWVLIYLFLLPSLLLAQKTPRELPNWKTPTMGGKQFWSDELVFHDWRIQRNSWMNYCRLLDGENHRRAWGTFEQCRAKLEELRRRHKIAPMKGKVIVALHGLIRTRASMRNLSDYLKQSGDYTVITASYASTRGTLDSHVDCLEKVIAHLGPDVTEINFVAHSLGNLVIRRWLDRTYRGEGGLRPDPRVHRIVMMAPPNHGSQLSRIFKNNVVFKWVWGKSGVQLGTSWDLLEKGLATPRCEFGILAGGGETPGQGRNRFLQGDNDFIVTVEETKLRGAADFAVLPVSHRLIMEDKTAQEYALRFFQQGYFISPSRRQPLE